MTEQTARDLVRAAVPLFRGVLTRQWDGQHLPTCQIGIWDHRAQPRPCSKRCQQIHDWLRAAEAILTEAPA